MANGGEVIGALLGSVGQGLAPSGIIDQALTARRERKAGEIPGMSEQEELESTIRQLLITYGKPFGWNDTKTSELLAGYLNQPTAQAKEQYWNEKTAGLPLWIEKNLKMLRDIRERPTAGGYFGAPYTPEEAGELRRGLGGEPKGMLEAGAYADPYKRMRKEYPGLEAKTPEGFKAGIQKWMETYGKGRKPLTTEEVGWGELQEMPAIFGATRKAAEAGKPKMYYAADEARQQAEMAFTDPRQMIVFDRMIEEMGLHETFADLDENFLSGIGIDSKTDKLITPTILADDQARLARKLLATHPTDAPTDNADLVKVAAFLYGTKALTPEVRGPFEQLNEQANRLGAVLPPEVQALMPGPTRSELQKLIFSEPALNLAPKEQFERALALLGTGLYDERTVTYILRLLGDTQARQAAYQNAKKLGILEGGGFVEMLTGAGGGTQPVGGAPKAGNILNDITRIIQGNPNINAGELANQLKRLGWSEQEIRSAGVS